MKICVIIDAWEPIWGGGQAHVWEISKSLVQHYGYEIDIFTRKITDGSKIKYPSIEKYYNSKLRILRIGPNQSLFSVVGRIIWIFAVTFQIIKNHRRSSYDLIHAHAYISALPGKILRTLIKLPIIFTVHGSHLMDQGKRNINYFIEKILLTKVKYDLEISVSRSFSKYVNVNKNILYISNGVNIGKFDNYLEKTNSRKNVFVFLWVGRFDWTKGIDMLLEAFEELLGQVKSRRKIILRLVGYGYNINKYQELARNLGIQAQVKFAGKKSGNELIKEYKSADIFVLPSLVEGQAVTIFEAWAAKLPVIASDAGDHSSIVRHGQNGYLVPVKDKGALVDSMMAAFKSKKLKKLGRSGYLATKKMYSWDRAAATQHRIYKQLVPYK